MPAIWEPEAVQIEHIVHNGYSSYAIPVLHDRDKTGRKWTVAYTTDTIYPISVLTEAVQNRALKHSTDRLNISDI